MKKKVVGSIVHVGAGSHVVPYSQQALDGDFGLSDENIAQSLGVDVKFVRQKLRRSGFMKNAKYAGFKMSSIEDFNKNGVRFTRYIFDVSSAKAFVAKWESEKGWGYLSFLLSCEKVVIEAIPRMIGELSDAKDIIKKLTKPKRGKLPSGESCVTLTQIEVRKDMFGTEYFEPLRVKVKMSDLDEAQHAEYKIRHITKIQKGLNKRLEKSLDKAVFVTPTNILKLKASEEPKK